jgi:peroxin-5
MGPSFFQGFDATPPIVADTSKGKGKAREADFEAAFAQVAASLQNQQQSTSSIVELNDTAASLEQAMENVKLGDPNTTNADFKEFVIRYFVKLSCLFSAASGITSNSQTYLLP